MAQTSGARERAGLRGSIFRSLRYEEKGRVRSRARVARIAEQIKANVFPVRLGPEDWTSGDTVWLLDVFAADRKQATSVLANVRKLAGERPVKIAPLVARLIDPEVAARLRGAETEARATKAARRLPPEIPEPQGRA